MAAATLVTGGTGFLGRHLIPALCRMNVDVRVLVRDPDAHPWLRRYPRVEAVRGDINDCESLERAANGVRHVIHAAGFFRFWGDDSAFYRTNVEGTQNMLRAAQTASVERFIHISTIALIGQPTPDRLIDETHPAHPVDPYQRSKLHAEQRVTEAVARGLPAVILRPGAFYGPLGRYAFNRLFFHDPMRGIIMQVNGGSYLTFPVYIGDVVQGILRGLEVGTPGEVYNICGDSLTHREVFDIVCAEASLRFPRLNIPGWLGISFARLLTAVANITGQEPFYPINLRSYVYNNWRVSNAKARRELGFVPTDFREGARRTIAWYRAGQPDDIAEVSC